MVTNVVVGIPAYNEGQTIADVVKRALPHATCVVVVDDGSVDATSAEALRAGAIVIRHEQNGGKGVAVATLFQYAIDADADVLVLLDGDGQHDPTEIPNVVKPCLMGDADMVVGSRFHRASTSYTPRIRRLGQHAFNQLTALASGVPCSDSQSGFRAFNRRAFCAMRLSEASFSIESEMQFECRVRQLRLGEAPINCSYALPPKRNVLVHGVIVLSRLTTMALQHRTLSQVPAKPLPATPRSLVSNDVLLEGGGLEPVLVMATGD